jgi:PAS domain S-box-containing protein
MGRGDPLKFRPFLLAVFGLLALGIAASGISFYAQEKSYLKTSKLDELAGIADLKVREISAWRVNQDSNALAAVRNPFTARALRDYLARPGDTALREQINFWMEGFRERYGYHSILLLDSKGKVRLSVPGSTPIDPYVLEQFLQAPPQSAPLFIDFYRTGKDGRIILSLIGQVPDPDHPEREAVGFFALNIDPHEFLYPSIQGWPTPSPTAEILLVEKQGEYVVYLNDLRHRQDTALTLRHPLGEASLPATKAAQALSGTMEGVDYRGEPVLAAYRPVPGLPWGLVAKVDQREVYAPLRQSATLLASLVAALVAAAGAILMLLGDRQTARLYRQERLALEERGRAQRELLEAERRSAAALRESEERVRHKLNTVLAPDGDISVLKLADILDPAEIQPLLEEFFKLTHFPMAIIDLEGRVLVGVGWQDVCTKFHRTNPESCKNCIESDVLLSSGVAEGEYKLYKCRNNMWDVATPLMVAGRHVGNIFTGQFFFVDEAIDTEVFRAQAKRFGFNEERYLAALESVPRISRESLVHGMQFFQKLAVLISRLSYSNLQLARTITERERAEEALRESEARYRALVEQATVGIAQSDLTGKLIFVNERYCEILGRRREDLLGLHLQDLTDERERPRFLPLFEQLVKEATGFSIEKRYLRPDGSTVWVENEVHLVYGTNAQPLYAQAITQDVTERKEIDRLKDEFISTAAHELRTPLAMVMGYTQLLQEGERFAPEEREEFLRLVYEKSEVLDRIIRDLLDLSRVQAGELVTIEKVRQNLASLVSQAVDGYRRITEHSFEIDFPDGPIEFYFDAGKICQVLDNLLSNAVKFSPGGGTVRVIGRPIGEMFELTVADEGIGMRPEEVARIFDKFYRVDASNTAVYGLGIGMSIVKSIVESHGGRISVESEPGRGTRVRFTLPMAKNGPE